MAGYLRQLAEQTLQPVTRLHSALVLPYSQATQEWGKEDPELLAGPEPRHPESTAMDPRAEVPPDNSFLKASRLTAQREREPVRQDSLARRDHALPEVDPTQRVASTSDMQRVSAHNADVQERPETPSSPVPTKQAHPVDIVAGKTSPRELSLHPNTPRLTPVVSARTSRLHQRSEVATRPRNANAAAAPEVHIHIGRIELTATAPVKAPKREATPVKKPMSLDEYLQQRRRAP